MSFLLDTDVVSEWVKLKPDPGVAAWLGRADEDRVFISVVTVAELRHGIERLLDGARRSRLDEWLTDALPLRFEGRVLGVDVATADIWGRMMARAQSGGRPVDAMDAWIAATARRHAPILVTRNVSDFESLDIALSNPWIVPASPGS